MKEKSKVLVVVGYHPDEPFALDVGMLYKSRQPSDVLVERYDDKPDRFVNVIKQPRLWRFIRRFSPVDYAVVLHDSYPEMEKITKQEREDPEEKWPDIFLAYFSQKKVPQSKREQFYELMLSTGFKYPFVRFEDSLKRFPKEFDEISLEYYHPHQISVQEGVRFLKELIEFVESI